MAETAKTPKAENYTAEQTAKMVSEYTATPTQETVEKIALELGKTVRSVIAKLSREKVYKAKTYKTKTGEEVTHKGEIADAIGKVLKLSPGEVDSLEKANKTALDKIFKALAMSKPIDGND